ncbi:MAG TPA: amidohydrolase family protein [Gemmatimonadaceae bacterium]|nr:amidohydrolase family protein [Gemmatimonadaceae bacterium]
MKRFRPGRVSLLLAALVASIVGLVVVQSGNARNMDSAAVAFVGVTVIPMDRHEVVRDQTVVTRDGRIVSVGPSARSSIPGEAIRVDGRGKFLMPGLAEMHAHVQGPQAPNAEEMNRDIMFLYVANGITSIRAMLGAPNQLVLRDQLAKGQILGPTMYVAAPSLNGQSAPDPETAERLVRAHKQAGYDLLKIHPGLTRPAYDAIVRTAREVGITWGGHVSLQVGIDHILDTKQSTVDHLDGYIEGAASEDIRRRIASSTSGVTLPEIWKSVTDARIRELARRTRQSGVWNVPTMFLWESFWNSGTPEEWAKRPEMKYAPQQWVNNWITQKKNRVQQDLQNGVSPADATLHMQLRRKMLKALADEGAPLLMGTDSPQMFNVPGFALHRELRVAIEAGLTPFQILESGTRNVGRYVASDLKQDGKFGTVTVGSRADLVLLNANPLENVGNLANRAGVMVRGRWIPRAEIDKGLETLATKYAR